MAIRCLIVDDSARFLEAARVLLEHEGISVVGVALTSEEAVRRVDQLQPDVMLLDIDLGGESGFELARFLDQRAQCTPSNAGAPRIILVSTHAKEDFEDLVAASPAVGFLDKAVLSARAIRELLSTPSSRSNRDSVDRGGC
jgi:CheY-like chemotaxis protein